MTAKVMNQITLVFILLFSSGTHPASAVYIHSPEEVTAVHNGTTGRACGVPAIKPVVSGCPSDGLGIVNGEEAVPHSWPWQVSLQDNRGFHFCGGSLINKDWVVTAAHCKVSQSHRLILGLHNRKETNNVKNMKIGKVFNHPDYSRTTLDYDIALIKLQQPAQMNKHVSPVCVAETSDIFYADTKCVVSGWGWTHFESREVPLKLQQVCLPLIGYDQCKEIWGSFLTRRMFCAGAAGSVTCHMSDMTLSLTGDSGGPLVCKKNGAWTLVGVSSWVKSGCITTAPAGFARVTALRAWMDKTMADN